MDSLMNCSRGLLCALLLMGSQLAHAAGIITTVAGGGSPPENIPAISADIQPQNVAVDGNGNLYVAGEYRVFRIDSNGDVVVVAGTGNIPGVGTSGYNGDGIPATDADLSLPAAIAVDAAGDLYIADRDNERIRKVDVAGMITTVAGGGNVAMGSDGSPAVDVQLGRLTDVAFDSSGNMYIADPSYNLIRKVDANGIITTVAGICSAGDCSGGFAGDGGTATAARLNYPMGVTVDATGNLFIADTGNNRIRKVDSTGIITTVAGDGTAGYGGDGGAASEASLSNPSQVAVDDAGNLYITDGVGSRSYLSESGNQRIRKVDAAGVITTVAGNGSAGFSGDGGAAVDAQLNYPSGVAVDGSGNLFIADQDNNRVREVAADGGITTVVGNGYQGVVGDGSPAPLAALVTPEGLAMDTEGNMYIADTNAGRVRKVDPNGEITTVAGHGYDSALPSTGDGAPAITARLFQPEGVALDGAGNLYIVDGTIKKVDTSGIITTVAGNGTTGYSGDGGSAIAAEMDNPQGIAVDAAGNLYISDTGNNCIRKVDGNGIITTVLGQGVQPVVSLNHPLGIALDASGNLYIADTYNNVVRKLDTIGNLRTVAGNGTASYSGDGGLATGAGLWAPSGVAVDDGGNLYILDAYNQRVRMVDSAGFIGTIAGNGEWDGTFEYGTYSGDGGPATSAGLNFPLGEFSLGIASDSAGNVYIADNGNNRIRRVGLSVHADAGRNRSITADPDGSIAVTLDGSGSFDADGDALTYSWSGVFGSMTGVSPTVSLDVGTWPIDLTVADDNGDSDTDTVTITVTAPGSPAPDLVVNDLSTTTTALMAGDTLSAATTVANIGNLDAGFFKVAFSLSADSVYGNGDDISLSGLLLVGGLAVDDSNTSSVSLIIPSSVAMGNYYLCAMVDSESAINEGYHEDNNTRCTATMIAVTYPDLVMTDVTPAALTVNQGDKLDVSNTVTNQGLLPSGFASVEFRLSVNSVYGDSDDVTVTATRLVPTLDSGESNLKVTRISLPSTIPPASYHLCAMADSGTVVTESDEDNNVLCASALVTVPKPDLVVSKVSTRITSRRAGTSINIYNAVVNQGGSVAGSSVVAFHLSTNTTYGDGDDIVSPTSRTIGSLAIGARSAGPTYANIPSSTPPGVYYMCVKADDADTVDESDEANNTACTDTSFTVH